MSDVIVHLGHTAHGLPRYLFIACEPFSYLEWKDYSRIDGAPTCLACIGTVAKRPGDFDPDRVVRVGGFDVVPS